MDSSSSRFGRTTIRGHYSWMAALEREHTRTFEETVSDSPLDQRRTTVRMAAIAVVIGMVAIKWLNIIRSPRGDFLNHWEFGRRILSGQFLYEFGLNIPYPPFWAMAHAPLTALSVGLAQSLVFVLAQPHCSSLSGSFDRFASRIPLGGSYGCGRRSSRSLWEVGTSCVISTKPAQISPFWQ